MCQYPSLYCVHLILERFLCWNNNHIYICCWVISIVRRYPNHRWVVTSSDCVPQQSIFCIACYHIHGMILCFNFSNNGYGHIFQTLELQTRGALKDHDMSDPSFRYLLEGNDWTPKHIKVNIQNSCTNIVLFSIWYLRFQRDVAPKNKSRSSHAK